MDVRAYLLATTTNATTGVGTIATGVEIQKHIDEMGTEVYNNSVDFSKMLRRVSINQLAYIWNVVTESAAGSGLTNTSFLFHTEGLGNVPIASTKKQLMAAAVGYRTDYGVSGLMVAAGMGSQIAEEARYAIEALAVGEEKQIICGTATSAYGTASGFAGLLQLMGSYVTFTHTTTVFGIARVSGGTYLDVSLVAATATTANNGTDGTAQGDTLSLPDLDAAITLSDNRGGKGHNRIFFCSNDRRDEIDQLLQAQQRFIAPSVEIAGGFRVSSYKNIPIIGSRFMDKNGIVFASANNTATTHYSYADQAMYLIDLDYMFMAHPGGMNAKHVPVSGGEITGNTQASFSGRSDQEGGYFKTYGVFVMKRFDTSVLIYNLKDI
jgi:hypothetical protein